jgi:ClpP class serine protease
VTKEAVMRGSRALMFSSSREFTKDEEERLSEIMKSFYEGFVKKVALARGMDFKSAEQLARGRVWTGRQAKENGLIDELGGIKEAIRIAKKEAGISADVSPIIRFFSKPKGIQLMSLSRGFTWRTWFDEFITGQVSSMQDFLETLEHEAVFALMPFWIDIK